MIKLGWWLLSLATLAAVVYASVFAPPGAVVAPLVVGVFLLVLYGKSLSYFRGIRRRVVRHMGSGWGRGQIVTHVIRTSERADFQLTLDRIRADDRPPGPVFGYAPRHYGGIVSVIAANPLPAPLEWESYPSAPGKTIACATNALYLLHDAGAPICVMIGARNEDRKVDRKQVELAILAPSREAGQSALNAIIARARRDTVYRGTMISLEKSEDRREEYAVKFVDLPAVSRDQIILPAEVMEVVERNVIGMLNHATALRRAGSSTRHGVLFHGPPGTGKTLVTRYYSRVRPEFTAILLTGRQLSLIRESCQLARMLAPSMVILEDVDLVASERRKNRHNTILHELMDEMDGMGEKAECVFLLTTNRPDILEPALAARPGRVDQAIYFPLPDADCRRRLLRYFGRKADLSAVDLDSLLTRTDGASPAFLAELTRKAVLMAAERGETSDPLQLRTEDFDRAIRELTEFGGELTQNLLSYARGKALSSRQKRPLE